MIIQTQGQIYLNYQRGCTDKTWYRSFHTFNFDSSFEEHKAGFGSLTAFNEDTLAAGKGITLDPPDGIEIIILPVAGGIEFKNAMGFQDYIVPGQVQVLRKDENGPYELINPYGVEDIHFIQLWVRKNSSPVTNTTEQHVFDPAKRNELSALCTCGDTSIHFGKYTGRAEGSYSVRHDHGVFVFVVQGAFEVRERLLQSKDGLTLWDLKDVEFEALSDDAILLLVETPLASL